MYKARWKYFYSIWNMLDCLAVILSPLNVILDLTDVVTDIELRPLISLSIIIFFLRFFYFLRIFDSSTKVVRIIIEITYDIKIFIFALFIAITGFGFSFYVLSNNNWDEEDEFISSLPDSFAYSY